MSLTACGGGNNPSPTPDPTPTEYKYGFEEMYERIWESNAVHNESIMLVEHEPGKFYGKLMFEPTKILAVKSQSLKIDYVEGTDYKVEGDKIVMLEGSKMPHFTAKNVTMEEYPEGFDASNKYAGKEDGTSIIFTEGDQLLTRQIAVSYVHSGKWQGTTPKKKGNKLELLRYRLKNKLDITSVTIGDSIFCGCNTSGLFGIEPKQAPFPSGFAAEIERVYGSKVDFKNLSKGGELSEYGRKNVMEVNNLNPDLVVIGFGMNDGSWNIAPDTYQENIEFMIKSIQANHADCSIIVCATILASEVSPQSKGKQSQYLPYLLELEEDYDNVAVLDMTTYSSDLFKKKYSLDLFSNNINHPCDWLARQYVANLMNLIEVDK